VQVIASQDYAGNLVNEFLTKGWSSALRQKVKDNKGTFMLRIRDTESDEFHVTEEGFNRGKQFLEAAIAKDNVLDGFIDRPPPPAYFSNEEMLQSMNSNMQETEKNLNQLKSKLSEMTGHVFKMQQSIDKTEPTVSDLKVKFDQLTDIAGSMLEYIENSYNDFAGQLDARGSMPVTLLIVVTVVNVMCTLITLFVTFRDRFGF
jgi:methyl-accepting chemotaxis protein